MRLFAASMLILVLLAGGCGPVMRDLQFGNPRTRLFPMDMTLSIGDGKVDAVKLIRGPQMKGSVDRPWVTVHYPTGMSLLAEQVASAFDAAAREIKARTGITWAFKPVVYLITVDDTSPGFRLRMSLRHGRDLRIPLLLSDGWIIADWSRGIGHELTEASMLASLNRRELVLGDYSLLAGGLVNETRWFRDGVSDFAGDILNRALFGEGYQPPWWIYRELADVRGKIIDWANYGNLSREDYYDASLGLVHELVNRAGDDAIARIMAVASQDRYINGSTLRRAVKKVTGLDLREFVSTYCTVWLGMDVRDTRRDPGNRFMVQSGNRVVVTTIYPGYPADKWKLQPGDTIVSIDGSPVISASAFAHYIAAHKPRDRVQVEIERAGERFTYRMMAVARDSAGVSSVSVRQGECGEADEIAHGMGQGGYPERAL